MGRLAFSRGASAGSMNLGFLQFLFFNQNSKSRSGGQPLASQSSLARALIASFAGAQPSGVASFASAPQQIA